MASPEGLRLAPWLAQRRRVGPDDLLASRAAASRHSFARASRGERELCRALTLTSPASFIGFNRTPPQVASVNSV